MTTDLSDEPVQIVPYNTTWPARFHAERKLLERAVGPWIVGGVHHVGSTAVPGLAAKPIIDILVGVESLSGSRGTFERLADLGYQYAPYRANEMLWFCKPSAAHRTHHLHLVPSQSSRFHDELAFRDALRSRPDLAEGYARLKRALVKQHRNDREAYTAAKAQFIVDVLHAQARDA
jgi:GrpB-like predicted nucleotidyltransferase (UPF0157 family)